MCGLQFIVYIATWLVSVYKEKEEQEEKQWITLSCVSETNARSQRTASWLSHRARFLLDYNCTFISVLTNYHVFNKTENYLFSLLLAIPLLPSLSFWNLISISVYTKLLPPKHGGADGVNSPVRMCKYSKREDFVLLLLIQLLLFQFTLSLLLRLFFLLHFWCWRLQ